MLVSVDVPLAHSKADRSSFPSTTISTFPRRSMLVSVDDSGNSRGREGTSVRLGMCGRTMNSYVLPYSKPTVPRYSRKKQDLTTTKTRTIIRSPPRSSPILLVQRSATAGPPPSSRRTTPRPGEHLLVRVARQGEQLLVQENDTSSSPSTSCSRHGRPPPRSLPDHTRLRRPPPPGTPPPYTPPPTRPPPSAHSKAERSSLRNFGPPWNARNFGPPWNVRKEHCSFPSTTISTFPRSWTGRNFGPPWNVRKEHAARLTTRPLALVV